MALRSQILYLPEKRARVNALAFYAWASKTNNFYNIDTIVLYCKICAIVIYGRNNITIVGPVL